MVDPLRLLAILVVAAALPAAEIRVATTGSDATGTGTAEQPFLTVERALAAVSATPATIRLGAGTFAIASATVALPSGIALVGAGRDATTLVGALDIRGTEVRDAYTFFFGAAYLAKPGARPVRNVAVRDLTLAGAADDADIAGRRATGILARDGIGLELRNLRLTRFATGAVHIERWTSATIAGVAIDRSTYNERFVVPGFPDNEHADYTTAFLMGDVADILIDGLSIDTRERGGRGIGSVRQRWEETTDDYNWERAELVRVTLRNAEVQVDQWHGWTTGSTRVPQMTVEWWSAYCEDVLVERCRFTNNLSLTADGQARYGTVFKPVPARTITLRNNLFDMTPPAGSPGSVYRYAIETYAQNLVVDRNVFLRGHYPFATWGTGIHARSLTGMRVTRNLFLGTGPYTGLLSSQDGTFPDLVFAHNTVVVTGTQYMDLVSNTATGAGQVIANNLFWSTVPQTVGIGFAGPGVDRNHILGFPTIGTGVTTGAPGLGAGAGTAPDAATGRVDWAPWIPQAGSALIDAGKVLAGITGVVGAPDIGALERGAAVPWFGPQMAPVITSAPVATPNPTTIP